MFLPDQELGPDMPLTYGWVWAVLLSLDLDIGKPSGDVMSL